MTAVVVVVFIGLLAAFLIDKYLRSTIDTWRNDEEIED